MCDAPQDVHELQFGHARRSATDDPLKNTREDLSSHIEDRDGRAVSALNFQDRMTRFARPPSRLRRFGEASFACR
jgi:hypothetical protein